MSQTKRAKVSPPSTKSVSQGGGNRSKREVEPIVPNRLALGLSNVLWTTRPPFTAGTADLAGVASPLVRKMVRGRDPFKGVTSNPHLNPLAFARGEARWGATSIPCMGRGKTSEILSLFLTISVCETATQVAAVEKPSSQDSQRWVLDIARCRSRGSGRK